MTTIQTSGPAQTRIPRRGEFGAHGGRLDAGARARREAAQRGRWRFAGLAGALVYSLVCWTLVYHGARGVLAWMKPTPQIEASANVAGAPER